MARNQLWFHCEKLPVNGPKFSPLLERQDWDVAELPLVTYLISRDLGEPFVLLPVAVQARFQHPYLVVDATRQTALESIRSIGVRSHSATTVIWIKAMLREAGIDPRTILWVATEKGDFPQRADSPQLQKAAGKDLRAMLATGEIDAAVSGTLSEDPELRPAFGDAAQCAAQWFAHHAFIQVNHVLVTREAVARESAREIRTIFELLREAKASAPVPLENSHVDHYPVGWRALEGNLKYMSRECLREQVITRPLEIQQMMHPLTVDMS